MDSRNVAFLGLGVMGYPMAGHLAKAGHRVTVYNRSADKAARWVSQHGGASAPTPAAAAKDMDLVLMCVGNDDDVRAVVLGENGALAAMRKGSTLVDHTTASAEIAREIHAAAGAKGMVTILNEVTRAVGDTRSAASKVLEASETVEAAATSLQRGIEGFLGRVAV